MKDNKHVLDVDLKKQNYIANPIVRKNDDVEFIINISDDGKPFDLSAVKTATIACERQDKVVVIPRAGAITGTNQVTFAVSKSALSVVGKVNATVQLYGDFNRVSTISFNFTVQKDPTGTDYMPDEGEKSLIEVVLGDGPLVIADARAAADEASTMASAAETAAQEADAAKQLTIAATANAKTETDYIKGARPLIEQSITDSTTAKVTAESVRTEFDAVVLRETDSDAMSRQAAINTDGVDDFNLKTRLDKEHREVTTALAETAPLPEWLQASIRDVQKKHDDYLRQFGVNVMQPPFNAKGDGIKDDQIAIQNAVNYALVNKKSVYFPKPGANYFVGSPIMVRGHGDLNIQFTGEKGAKLVKGNGEYPILDIDSDIPFTGGYHQRIANVFISSLDFESPNSFGNAIKLRRFGYIYFNDVYAYRFKIGYDIAGGSEAWFTNVRWAGGELGLKLEAIGVDMQTVYFTDCIFTNGVKGVTISDTYDVHFTRTVFTALSAHSFLASSGVQNVYFNECHYEWGSVSAILLNSFIGATFDKCEFAQTGAGHAPPIEVNNIYPNSKLRIKDSYHEVVSQPITVYVKETSKNVDIIMQDNLPELINSSIRYEKTKDKMTNTFPLQGNPANIFNRDFTKGFVGYVKSETSVALSLDSAEKLSGANSVKFNAASGFWDFLTFSRYNLDVLEGSRVNIDFIIKGTGFSSGIMRGVLKDLNGGADTEIILESGGNSLRVETYPNGFSRWVVSYIIPVGKQLTLLKISNSQNPSVNLYVDYVDIRVDVPVIYSTPLDVSAPTEGTFKRGDRIINRTPSAGGYEGWVCITAGTPGTWKGYGLIQT